jgi:hypothetical protein
LGFLHFKKKKRARPYLRQFLALEPDGRYAETTVQYALKKFSESLLTVNK